ncbi:SDR family oxidoreductase [Mangrovivirga cuniculi]|uniref:SDR family oxidoreductase n=1 Tax=Mangrovivirga cuniculi TaxID=2715131 RepID=UPI002938E1A0|nr:SDR family oxidoreductase [Mangrovivirga cuniculi]
MIKKTSTEVITIAANVLDKASLTDASDEILEKWGKVDILINAAGGNVSGATIGPDDDFFKMNIDDFSKVTDLNLQGSVLPSLIFGQQMAKQNSGCIINISSVAAHKPLTRVVGYAAAKASIENFTKWMAVEMAQKYSAEIRVNAIAPGFFIGEQNRNLLLKDDGSLTERGEKIIEHIPIRRFGRPEELISTVLWLCSDSSSLVTGITVPVDGGFTAYSGI